MHVVPITVFDKAKLKKELFEIVGIAKPQFAFVFPKKEGISIMEISFQQL